MSLTLRHQLNTLRKMKQKLSTSISIPGKWNYTKYQRSWKGKIQTPVHFKMDCNSNNRKYYRLQNSFHVSALNLQFKPILNDIVYDSEQHQIVVRGKFCNNNIATVETVFFCNKEEYNRVERCLCVPATFVINLTIEIVSGILKKVSSSVLLYTYTCCVSAWGFVTTLWLSPNLEQRIKY